MKQIPCCHCSKFFSTSPRHKNQTYCMKLECRRAKKAAWQRKKMHTDPDYRYTQKISNEEWTKANPDYWKEYRKRNPKQTERNRILQTIRNRRRYKGKDLNAKMDVSPIAKMDASNPKRFKVVGQFWLVPLIAKMDASKVNIYEISNTYD